VKLDRKIVIEEADVSGLHAEIEDVLDYFVEHSCGKSDWVTEEFPHLNRLKGLLTSAVLSEPGERVYEKMQEVVKRSETREENRCKRLLKVVVPTKV